MKINRTIITVLKVYLLALTIFTIFRGLLFASEIDRVDYSNVDLLTIFQSFVMGIRFDIVISGYILLLPTFICLVLDLFRLEFKLIKRIFFYWSFFFFTIAFAIAAADIPYFNHFYDRFSIGAFQWIENLDFVVSMIVQEPKYFLIVIPFVIFVVVFYKQLSKIFSAYTRTPKSNIFLNSLITLLFLAIMVLGIRGRLEKKSPIRIGTAYFSDNSFLNKLGLNPVFTLMRSYIDHNDSDNKAVILMDEGLAVEKVQDYLNIKKPKYNSPIARDVRPETITESRPNIVVVIMESMCAAKMSRHGSSQELTPFLDSLSQNSLYFENVYTAGKHTFNGVFSTLFSFPALYRQHPMKIMRKYDGMASKLVKKGYSTTYFTTHDSQFDNVEGFLKANDVQNVVSESDYPQSEVKTTLGVPDDYMFRYSIPYISELSKTGDPFFVSFMTASDHGPYYIPEYFAPKSDNIKSQIVEYADWSLQQFMNSASEQHWFDNTIFVFVADHGAPLDAHYDIALNYFHTPLIIHAPSILSSNKTYDKIGSQIDIFPTIMGLINQEYTNNTMGIDLINQNRKYAIINDDDKIGIIDTSYFCIMKPQTDELKLYKYRERNTSNLFGQNKNKAIEMADYAKSHMQVYQNMMLSDEVVVK